MCIFREATEAKFEELNNVSDGKSETNGFEAYPSSLDEAKKRNRKIIEVKLNRIGRNKVISY